ncbi:MAG: polysaccharide deacetylase family protein [Magnetococcales bacterium]|nr:polysaccharide deacetylase family protein [Magnetococcales bacterium]MBF0322043.1 polysaccharide deacetylase family protein [Magnetococcales bacterium]
MLTIVMYHYVRDLPNTPWPGIKGLLTRHFDGQLDYLQRHYEICSQDQCMAALTDQGAALPNNACLLTFDDGLRDHYDVVLPRLLARGLTGCFFPIVEAVENRWVMIVHKVHHILAGRVPLEQLFDELLALLAIGEKTHALPPVGALLAACNPGAARYDDARTIQFKRLLQQVLPRDAAWEITSELFRRHVTEDEAGFAEELYLSKEQLRTMIDAGMSVGGHGVRHNWMEHLSQADQRDKMLRSQEFLTRIHGAPPQAWIMNYPYGSHDARSVAVAREIPGCRLALTTRPGLVTDFSHPYQLPRLDTNDLPKQGDAPPCAWTQATREGRRPSP